MSIQNLETVGAFVNDGAPRVVSAWRPNSFAAALVRIRELETELAIIRPAPLAIGRPQPRDIIRRVALKHGLTVDQIRSRTNQRKIAWPRQEAMAMLRDQTTLSFPAIARMLGLTDHTTVIKGIRAFEKRLMAE